MFNIGQDPNTHKSGLTLDYTHNGKKMIGLTAEMTNANGLTDLSKLTSSNSIMDIMQAVMLGNSLDNLEITLLDDLQSRGMIRGQWHDYIKPVESIEELKELID